MANRGTLFLWECDVCGAEVQVTGKHRPINWRGVDESDVCKECWDLAMACIPELEEHVNAAIGDVKAALCRRNPGTRGGEFQRLAEKMVEGDAVWMAQNINSWRKLKMMAEARED